MLKEQNNEQLQVEQPNIRPALLTIQQVCEYLNISRAEFYRLDANGKFAPLPVGLCRKRLYLRSEIEAWVNKAGCPHRKVWQAIKETKL